MWSWFGGKERGVLGVGIGACVREAVGLEDAKGLGGRGWIRGRERRPWWDPQDNSGFRAKLNESRQRYGRQVLR